MKIAIPTVDGVLCPHFGHCQQFAIVNVDPETKSIKSSEMLTPPPHEPGVLPAWLSDMAAISSSLVAWEDGPSACSGKVASKLSLGHQTKSPRRS